MVDVNVGGDICGGAAASLVRKAFGWGRAQRSSGWKNEEQEGRGRGFQ